MNASSPADSAADASAIRNTGAASSFSITPVANDAPTLSFAFLGRLRLTVNVSFSSKRASSRKGITIAADAEPGSRVRTPLTAA